MKSIGKALWYIESHFGSDISLSDVANAAKVSKYHLVRLFGLYTGNSVMRHVRARRLSEAAKRLVNGADGILDVALEAGYGSHEAFTRAFSEQFGITPDQLRRTRSLGKIKLVEPLKMDEKPADLPEPRYVDMDELVIVGLRKRYNESTSAEMPAQWQAFLPYMGSIDNQVDNAAYGVLCNSDDDGNIDYLTGVEVSQVPVGITELESLHIAPRQYAVFQHHGHVSEIRRTWKTIFGEWIPEDGYEVVNAPQLERYGENFNPETGMGGLEIWIPVGR
jgi:AraC family transcriptional regulator